MFLCSLKICLVLLWGISGLFSPKCLSESAPVTSNMTSTSDPNLTTEHVDMEPGAGGPTRASAETSVSAAAAEEPEGLKSNHSFTGSVFGTASSSTPEQLQAFTAGDAGDSTRATVLGTPAPTHAGATTAESLPPAATGLKTEAAASTPSPAFTVSRYSSDTSTTRRDSTSGGAPGSGPTPSPVTKPEASTNNLNLLVVTASNSSSVLIYLDGSTADSASTSGSTLRSTSLPISGSTSGSTLRSTSASSFGSTSGSTLRSTSASSLSPISGSTSGSTLRSTSSPISGSTSGSTLRSTSSPISGSTSGSTLRSTSASSLSPISGSTSGSTLRSSSSPISGSTSGSTSGSSSTSPAGIFLQHSTNMAPNPTNKQTPATTTASAAQPCSTRAIMSQCLIAIATVAFLAAIFMVSTIILCAKLSVQNSKVKKPQPATELMCISSLLPERNYTYTRQRNPVANGVLVIHNAAESDEDGGDNLTLSSFLPENDRFV